jgi:hypothetical protein
MQQLDIQPITPPLWIQQSFSHEPNFMLSGLLWNFYSDGLFYATKQGFALKTSYKLSRKRIIYCFAKNQPIIARHLFFCLI